MRIFSKEYFMLNKNYLLIALGLAGWAAFSLLGSRQRQHAKHRERKQLRHQLHTWEGEGGNLPASTNTAGNKGNGRHIQH
jgi:hypothetical protein